MQASDFTVNAAGTKITVHAPESGAGTVNITVQTPSGTSPTSGADQYTYS